MYLEMSLTKEDNFLCEVKKCALFFEIKYLNAI